ncbi:PspC domain-containing protein [Ancrocorticia populi]|uniref:ATP-binding protein n=1 Tax=Ancrocorticia populi TaxID=2175228 RepID=UPI002704B47B|nr:PspC domain-containing protein [Ancrocorticia sp.]
MEGSSQTERAQRYPLRRPKSGRVIFGVCQGIADHLDVPVKTVRMVVALSVLVFGAGIVLYLWLFITVPASSERPASVKLAPVPRKELGRRQKLLLYAGIAVAAAGLVLLGGALNIAWGTVLGIVCIVAGAGFAWSNLSAELSTNQALARLGGGIALLVIGVLVLTVRDQPMGRVISSVVLGVGILAVAGLALWPVIQRLVREVQEAEKKSARESERAQMAAHLHDSVLQTLTLIRNQAADPEAVGRLARVQERQLRSWLYSDLAGAEQGSLSLAEAIRDAAGQIEDLYGVPIETVVVGEADGGGASEMLLGAVKEALANAVRHGQAPVTLYAELSGAGADVSVRDHGEGFDLAAIPADRHGVRDSIIGRIRGCGGEVNFRQRDPGTEVQIQLKWTN